MLDDPGSARLHHLGERGLRLDEASDAQPGTRVALLPPARIDGARVDVVQIARGPKGASRARLYMNRATKMVVRIQPIDELGNFGPVTELSHYRRVAGVAFAHRWHYHNMWIDWQGIGIDQPLPAGLFVPPKQKGRVDR